MSASRIVVRRWSELSGRPLTEESVRALYSPPGKYRVSVHRYPAGTTFMGSMRAGACHVLAGTCRYRFGAQEVALRAEDVASLPEGEYSLVAGPDAELRMVLAWELPEAFWQPGRGPLEWVESAGGPLVMIPRSRVSSWQGIDGDDYDAACGINDYLGTLARSWGAVLVLGDEPMPAAWLVRRDGPVILRWMYAPDEAALVKAALDFEPGEHRPAERLAVQLHDEPYVMFDSGRPGQVAEGVDVRWPSGTRTLSTYVVRDGEVGFVLHRIDEEG